MEIKTKYNIGDKVFCKYNDSIICGRIAQIYTETVSSFSKKNLAEDDSGIKITTSDLRLGNWLYESDKSKFPMQVESIGKNWIYLDFEDNEGDVFENSDKEIYPIPLTKELLEKIGFVYRGNHVYEYKDNGNILFDGPDDWNNIQDYPIQIIGGNGNYFIGYIPHGETIIRCIYVHQLQNFFYCITGKELEIRREWL